MTSPIAAAIRAQAAALVAVADALDAQSVASDVLDVAQAAAIARCSPRSVRAAINRGNLAARGTGRHVVITRADLDGWLADLPPRPTRTAAADEINDDEIDARVVALARGAA